MTTSCGTDIDGTSVSLTARHEYDLPEAKAQQLLNAGFCRPADAALSDGEPLPKLDDVASRDADEPDAPPSDEPEKPARRRSTKATKPPENKDATSDG